MSNQPNRRRHQSPSTGRLPRMDVEVDFDEYVLACVFSRALEEIDAGEATATEATGLSRADLRDILTRLFPARLAPAFSLEKVSDPALGPEEELLRGMLLAHARADDITSARFAKIIARRALRNDHLWHGPRPLQPGRAQPLACHTFPEAGVRQYPKDEMEEVPLPQALRG
ncbi:hypothetical protein QO004_006075 [Rhizobium mesoamericanum]|nr:hypothetical protein [Rhizobium mesoamericanum]